MRAALLLLLGGCVPLAAVLDPPLAQLARWERATPAAIAAEPVACPPGHPACPRLHQRRAEACMGLAMAARAPGAACPGTAAYLRCAVDGYAAAGLRAQEGQAALCLAEFSPPAEALALASRATATPVLAARATLLAARHAAPAQRCATLHASLAVAGGREAADLRRALASCPPQGDAR